MNGQGPKGSAILPNSESIAALEDRSEVTGVSSVSERVLTPPKVKVSKLLTKRRRVFESPDSGAVGSEVAIS